MGDPRPRSFKGFRGGRRRGGAGRRLGRWLLAAALIWAPPAPLGAEQYTRPTDTAPAEKDIGGGYKTPPVQHPLPRAAWWQWADAALLAAAMGFSAWAVLRRRRRAWLVALTIACLLYFGFHRQGCICPIGSIQNVTVALVDPGTIIPVTVILFFFLPLAAALLFGRVFCGGVCPLGAIQDVVLIRPVQVPRRLDRILGAFKYLYLAAAIAFAALPAEHRDFIICRFDPFVGFFRQGGPGHMLLLGGAFLVAGIFIGRPYCRYFCPYGALLSLLSRISWRGVTITPRQELDCGLCAEACPFGAIEKMRAVRSSCLFCARCYAHCPEQRAEWEEGRRGAIIAPEEVRFEAPAGAANPADPGSRP